MRLEDLERRKGKAYNWVMLVWTIVTSIFFVSYLVLVQFNVEDEKERFLCQALGIGALVFVVLVSLYVAYNKRKWQDELERRIRLLSYREKEEVKADLKRYNPHRKLLLAPHYLYGEGTLSGKVHIKGFYFNQYTNIVWAYELEQSVYGKFTPYLHKIGAYYKYHALCLCDREGYIYIWRSKEAKDYQEVLKTLKAYQPKCIIGYQSKLKRLYKQDPTYFISRVETNYLFKKTK